MSDPVVLTEIADGVARVTINQPAAANTLTLEVMEALEAAVTQLERDPSIIVVVLTGAGSRHFCSGVSAQLVTGDNGPHADVALERAWWLVRRIIDLPQVVIGAINGAAFAGGFALAVACDLRVAADHATFTDPGTSYGLAVGTFLLPYEIGISWAKEVILLAKTVSADEAYRIGMVHQVVPAAELPAAVDALIARLRELSPQGLRSAKTLINRTARAGQTEVYEAELEGFRRDAPAEHVQGNIRRAIEANRAARGRRTEK